MLALSTLARDLRLEGHLEECRRMGADWRDCWWCLSAVSIPEIDLVLGTRQDARALVGCGVEDTVAWVVAASELRRAVEGLDLSAVLVPSVRRLAHRLLGMISVDLEALTRRLRAAVAADGPIERRCLQTAAVVMATSIQRPEHAAVLAGLPERLRTGLLGLSGTLSSPVELGGLLPTIEDRHWRGLPAMRTQPEWRRRPGRDDGPGVRARQAAGAGLTAGSLEALVMESVTDRVVAEVAAIEDDLVGAAPPVPLARPLRDPRHTPTTRSLLWRVARIDWHLTFVDTGQAECWNARVEGDVVVTDVPWSVAVAIDATDAHGFISATHQDRANVFRVDQPERPPAFL